MEWGSSEVVYLRLLTPARARTAPVNNPVVTPNNDDLTPSSPIRPCRKRLASSSPPATGRKGRKRNADATSDVATAIGQIAQSLKGDESPHGEEETEVMLIFADDEDARIAQTYVAGRTKEKRTKFIRKVLERKREDDDA
ncbi:hypothetical protein R3P38DRAFT_3234367 [Favolaschia claudopus]|uniref:Uncharacterized protein n=1 Tax=Favolaschia claudopus TaxID=2862362 RepID=A0AAV9ZG79_9AGAR